MHSSDVHQGSVHQPHGSSSIALQYETICIKVMCNKAMCMTNIAVYLLHTLSYKEVFVSNIVVHLLLCGAGQLASTAMQSICCSEVSNNQSCCCMNEHCRLRSQAQKLTK